MVLALAASLVGGCSSDTNVNGVVDDQQIVPDNATAQTLRVGKRLSVEIDLPTNAFPS